MRVKLVMDDWRSVGESGSIYDSELGVELSRRDMHSGTVFVADVDFVSEHEKDSLPEEMEAAFRKHGAYPVFWMIPMLEERE